MPKQFKLSDIFWVYMGKFPFSIGVDAQALRTNQRRVFGREWIHGRIFHKVCIKRSPTQQFHSFMVNK